MPVRIASSSSEQASRVEQAEHKVLAGLGAEASARFQFALTMSFHIVLPALTIGLASFRAVLKFFWLAWRDDAYLGRLAPAAHAA